jgi:hypothetical protein
MCADGCTGCMGATEFCPSLDGTASLMGSIHPRIKRPVGQRLAHASAVVVYGKQGVATGPTLSGCRLESGGRSITLAFNASLLGTTERVAVQPGEWQTWPGASKMRE